MIPLKPTLMSSLILQYRTFRSFQFTIISLITEEYDLFLVIRYFCLLCIPLKRWLTFLFLAIAPLRAFEWRENLRALLENVKFHQPIFFVCFFQRCLLRLARWWNAGWCYPLSLPPLNIFFWYAAKCDTNAAVLLAKCHRIPTWKRGCVLLWKRKTFRFPVAELYGGVEFRHDSEFGCANTCTCFVREKVSCVFS